MADRVQKLEEAVRAAIRLRKSFWSPFPNHNPLSWMVPKEAVQQFDDTIERLKDEEHK